MTTAKEALDWMKEKAAIQGNQILFRGQNRVWPTIKPSITRLDEQAMREMSVICRWFLKAAEHGLTGFHIPNKHDRLAILQHYIGRSPVIDLTGTPEIALYFALQGAEPTQSCVVYSVDPCATPSDVVFSDHSFLALPLSSGGLKHRWLLQDGYSVGPADWQDLSVVNEFDLLKLPGVESKCFQIGSADGDLIRHLHDLEDIASDPLALAVRGTITSVAHSLGLLTPGIVKVLDGTKTRDPAAELTAELERLISLARTVNAPSNLIDKLKELWPAVGGFYWDTSYDCALDKVRDEIHRLVPMVEAAEQDVEPVAEEGGSTRDASR